VLAAMTKTGVKRIVCMSNVGAGGSGTWFYNAVVLPIFLRWLKPIIEDKNRMEELLKSSQLDWVSVRLPNIVAGHGKPVRTSEDGKGIGISISAESTAEFLLQQVSDNRWFKRTPSISN
jgi:nucleoside-diphosphate-sugar epimerase